VGGTKRRGSVFVNTKRASTNRDVFLPNTSHQAFNRSSAIPERLYACGSIVVGKLGWMLWGSNDLDMPPRPTDPGQHAGGHTVRSNRNRGLSLSPSTSLPSDARPPLGCPTPGLDRIAGQGNPIKQIQSISGNKTQQKVFTNTVWTVHSQGMVWNSWRRERLHRSIRWHIFLDGLHMFMEGGSGLRGSRWEGTGCSRWRGWKARRGKAC